MSDAEQIGLALIVGVVCLEGFIFCVLIVKEGWREIHREPTKQENRK